MILCDTYILKSNPRIISYSRLQLTNSFMFRLLWRQAFLAIRNSLVSTLPFHFIVHYFRAPLTTFGSLFHTIRDTL